MKKRNRITFAGVAFTLLLSAVSCSTSESGYTVSGTLPDSTMNGQQLYLMRYDDACPIDSTIIQGNAFTFSGQTDTIQLCQVSPSHRSQALTFCILENADIQLDMTEKVQHTGTPLNEMLAKAVSEYDRLNKQISEHQQKMMENNPELTIKEWKEVYINEMQPTVDEHIAALFTNNENTPIGELLTNFFLSGVSLDKQLQLIESLSPELQNLKQISQRKIKLEGIRNTSIGQPYTDIKGVDIAGNPIALSDFIGKGNYVLMDVWASWCGPCKQEIPNLAHLHKLYKDKGLTVVGVFVWDQAKNLVPAMEKEGITWPQIIDSNENATLLYGIGGIPEIILFSPEGKILERKDNLRGEQMIKTVENYLR